MDNIQIRKSAQEYYEKKSNKISQSQIMVPILGKNGELSGWKIKKIGSLNLRQIAAVMEYGTTQLTPERNDALAARENQLRPQ